MSPTPRELLQRAAQDLVAKCVSEDKPLYAAIEARRLALDHPNSGASEREIAEMLLRLAIDWNLVIDTMDGD